MTELDQWLETRLEVSNWWTFNQNFNSIFDLKIVIPTSFG